MMNIVLKVSAFRVTLVIFALICAGLSGARCEESAVLPSKAEVRAMRGASPTMQWAVERVAKELAAVYKIDAAQNFEARTPFDDSQRDRAQVFLGVSGRSSALAQWCREQGISGVSKKAGSNAYCVAILRDPLRVLILGSDDMGAWYGACQWLDSLTTAPGGLVKSPVGEMTGSPALKIRIAPWFTNPPDTNGDWVTSQIPFLDWCARWRFNAYLVGPLEVNTERYLAEAHKRGIRVIQTLGTRDVCPSDEKQVAALTAQEDEFLKRGGDGVTGTWDDLFGERIQGHCEVCRKRFGPNGITKEIIFILEALTDVARKYPGKIIIWCPPNYGRGRYKELTDEEFFGKISASKKVRTGTYLWYTQCGDEPTSFLDRYGMKRRVWWYNGVYPLSYAVVRHKPQEAKDRVKGKLGNLDFSPFDAAGFMKDIIKTDDIWTIYPPGNAKWNALRQVGDRFQGMYFCGPGTYTTPFQAAQAGLFEWSPKLYQQSETDKTAFRAIFGPDSEGPPRKWSDLKNDIEVRLAKKIVAGESLSDAEKQEISGLMELWRKERVEVEALAARGRSLAPKSFIDPMLASMRAAEANVSAEFAKLSGQGGASDKAN